MMDQELFNSGFYKGKSVLVTGHTGFKGSWMCQVLKVLGADVTGYGLEPPTSPSLFDLCEIGHGMNSIRGDVRDLDGLQKVFAQVRPELVIHMAAQPIVRESYRNPVYTYDVNVMGTVHVLECVRRTPSVRSVVNVTTDKVYRNQESGKGFLETDELNGMDPYSNSKSCSELATSCYVRSFLQERNVAVSTVRAGNVIGGGDFAADRIIPDCFRAASQGKEIFLRNPGAVRPFEHVLEPVFVYLMIAARQYENGAFAGSYNVGPDERDCCCVEELVQVFCEKWKDCTGETLQWSKRPDNGPQEAGFLRLDCTKLKETFGWRPVWNKRDALEKTARWYGTYQMGGNVKKCMERQIGEFYEITSKIWKMDQQDRGLL